MVVGREIPGATFSPVHSVSFDSSGFYSVDLIVRWVTETAEKRVLGVFTWVV